MELKIKKIDECEKINSEVQAQGCNNDCTETIWSGRVASEGWKNGCWSTSGQTSRTVVFW